MVKSTLYTTAKVLPGNRIEIESPELTVGQTVEVVILVEEVSSDASSTEDISPSLKQRLAFLKLPMTERRNILKSQADIMLSHYQQDSEWQELMAGDIIENLGLKPRRSTTALLLNMSIVYEIYAKM